MNEENVKEEVHIVTVTLAQQLTIEVKLAPKSEACLNPQHPRVDARRIIRKLIDEGNLYMEPKFRDLSELTGADYLKYGRVLPIGADVKIVTGRTDPCGHIGQ